MTSRTRTIYKPAIVFALLACLATILVSQPASAHANLLKASPEPLQVLDAPPERVIIWFTEPVEPAFSAITVVNPAGATVTASETQFDPTEPTAIWVPLDPLESGTYAVVWRNVSSVDGHKATGSFLFAVGDTLGAGAQTDVANNRLSNRPPIQQLDGSSTSASQSLQADSYSNSSSLHASPALKTIINLSLSP